MNEFEDEIVAQSQDEPQSEPVAEPKGKELYEWMQALVWSVLGVVLLFTFVVRLVGVDGSSMYPTLLHGDRLLVVSSLLDSDYQAGDIVVLRKESFMEQPIVKRVIATEGQTVDINFILGQVFVDGVLLEEDYIHELTYTDEGITFPIEVPAGSVFVMGDNRNHSSDSRNISLGTVDEGYIIGKAAFLLFPGEGQEDTAFEQERDWSRIGFFN